MHHHAWLGSRLRAAVSSPDGGAFVLSCKGTSRTARARCRDTDAVNSQQLHVVHRPRLVEAIATMAQGTSVIEFGSGMGCYVAALKDSHRLAWAEGFDGAPAIGELTRGLVRNADLTNPNLRLGCADVVLCLEVAEHIPPAFEGAFLRNLDAHNARTIILSWSPRWGQVTSIRATTPTCKSECKDWATHLMRPRPRCAARINGRASVARFDRAVRWPRRRAGRATTGGGRRSAGAGEGCEDQQHTPGA